MDNRPKWPREENNSPTLDQIKQINNHLPENNLVIFRNSFFFYFNSVQFWLISNFFCESKIFRKSFGTFSRKKWKIAQMIFWNKVICFQHWPKYDFWSHEIRIILHKTSEKTSEVILINSIISFSNWLKYYFFFENFLWQSVTNNFKNETSNLPSKPQLLFLLWIMFTSL